MSAAANKALARRWFASPSYHDALVQAMERDPDGGRESFFRALIAEVYTPDCIMHYPDSDGNTDRILRYHLAMMDAFPDLSFGIDDLVAEGDRVAVRGWMRGTNTGPFQGRPPTGNRVTTGFITICRCSGGKIAETWGYNDMAGFLRQLGIRPGP